MNGAAFYIAFAAFGIQVGFAGALLHTINHALFKSLLFLATGFVIQA